MRDFQERYHPLTKMISRAELKDTKLKTSADLAKRLPKLCFLFRDPCVHSTMQPVSESRVQRFWCLLVEELERRLEAKGLTNPDGGKIELVLSRDAATQTPTCVLFDMHSVRVTGLTALANAGVPLHILSEMLAGHASFLMTLYYQKPSAGEVTRALDEALLAISADEEREWIDFLHDRPVASIAAVAALNDPSAADEMRLAQPGLWSRMDIGLCPNGGTKCSSGGERLKKSALEGDIFAPVPGGPKNCALCRHFVTGPLYLGGLVAHLNATSGEVRELFLLQAAKQSERRKAVAERDTAKPDNRRKLAIKVIHLDEAIEKIDDDLDVLSRRWAALLRLILRSKQIVKDGAKSRTDGGAPSSRNALVMSGDDLQASFSRCTDFALWDSICRSTDFHAGVTTTLPNLRRGKLYDIVFGRSGMPPVFLRLDDAEALEVGNRLSRFLRSQVNGETLDDLIAGDVSLDELGLRELVEECLTSAESAAPVTFEPSFDHREQRLLAAPAGAYNDA